MAKYVIFKTEVPHFKKEGKMERKQIGSFGWKRQPVAQATGASEMENNKKRVTTMKNHNYNFKVHEKV